MAVLEIDRRTCKLGRETFENWRSTYRLQFQNGGERDLARLWGIFLCTANLRSTDYTC